MLEIYAMRISGRYSTLTSKGLESAVDQKVFKHYFIKIPVIDLDERNEANSLVDKFCSHEIRKIMTKPVDNYHLVCHPRFIFRTQTIFIVHETSHYQN